MNQPRRVVAVTVRSASSRLPNKCHLPIGSYQDKPISILEHVVDRLVREQFEVFVCTSTSSSDDPIVEVSKQLNVGVFRGSEHNKVARWHSFMEHNSLSHAHFLDCDDPFYCALEVKSSFEQCWSLDKAVLPTIKSESGNASVGGTLTFDLLDKLMKQVGTRESFEMVFPFLLREHAEQTTRLRSLDPLPMETRLTVDYFDDYLMACLLWRYCNGNYSRSIIQKILDSKPWLLEVNQSCNEKWKNRQNVITELEDSNA